MKIFNENCKTLKNNNNCVFHFTFFQIDFIFVLVFFQISFFLILSIQNFLDFFFLFKNFSNVIIIFFYLKFTKISKKLKIKINIFFWLKKKYKIFKKEIKHSFLFISHSKPILIDLICEKMKWNLSTKKIILLKIQIEKLFSIYLKKK